MCFSPEADLVAGLVVGGIGVDAVRHVRRPSERLLASIPLVLAAHQLIEVAVWWGLDGDLSHATWRAAMYAYLAIAFGVVPVLIPAAITALEPPRRRLRMVGFVVAGCLVAGVLLVALVRRPVRAAIESHHIAYHAHLWHGGIVVVLYVVATCGPALFSSYRHIRRYGVGNLVAVCALAWLDQSGLISLWCVWAAVTSVAIALHLRSDRRLPEDEPVEGLTEGARGAPGRVRGW
jgi:hypothetical protein